MATRKCLQVSIDVHLLIDCNRIRTPNHLVGKRALNHLVNMALTC